MGDSQKQRILVTGGAGYVGSHVCKALAVHGFEPVCLDDLSTGHRELVKWGPLHEADLRDAAQLENILSGQRFAAVIHLAARIDITESVRDPLAYFALNVGGTIALLRALKTQQKLPPIIFSSSAAVYGDSSGGTLDESAPILPTTPYGSGKRMVEEILGYLWQRFEWPSINLRYFNVAGADPENETGESHEPETHLIPRLLMAAGNPGLEFEIFGSDYPTADGTCVRDYVHVSDVAGAHVQALKVLLAQPQHENLNIGYGNGCSVLEIAAAIERVTGRSIRRKISPRRPGDPARLVADARRAALKIGWEPRFAGNLDAIIGHAWAWHQKSR